MRDLRGDYLGRLACGTRKSAATHSKRWRADGVEGRHPEPERIASRRVGNHARFKARFVELSAQA